MENYGFLKIFIFVIFCCNLIALIEKEVSLFFKQEKINNIIFSYKISYIDGKKEEIFVVGENQVSYDEYQDKIAEAYKNEALEKKRKELADLCQDEEFKQQIKFAACKKLLKIKVELLEKHLEDFDRLSIKQYIIFDNTGIESEAEFSIIKNLVLDAKNICLDLEKPDNSYINELLLKLEFYESKVINCFQKTVKNGIAMSDDTKILKELLSI